MNYTTISAAASGSVDRAHTKDRLSARWILPALALFCLVWLAYLSAVTSNAPVDNIEQLTWVRSLEWGYFKHPPLPTWLIWPAVQLQGLHAHTSYFMGALCKGLALAGFWWLMCRLRGPSYAAIALMAACCIVYYSRHLHIYNHNVVMFATVVAAAICCWQAWALRSLRWWGVLGVVLGLGFLTKYQTVVTVTCVVAFFAWTGDWRDRAHWRGAAFAAVLCGAVVTPHLWWLLDNPINPLTYAVSSSLGAAIEWPARLPAVTDWVIDHLFNRGLGALLLLGGLAWMYRGTVTTNAKDGRAVAHDAARKLMLVFALVPIVFIVLTVLLLGAESRKHWGTAYLIWMVPAVMEVLRRVKWQNVSVRSAFTGFLLIQFVLLLDHQWTTVTREADTTQARVGQPMASNWAATVAQQARFELNTPIKVVSGPETISAAFALQLPEKPLVLLEDNSAISPWVPDNAPGNCGGVHIGWGAPPEGAHELKGGPPGLYWQVIPEVPDGNCPLNPRFSSRASGKRLMASR